MHIYSFIQIYIYTQTYHNFPNLSKISSLPSVIAHIANGTFHALVYVYVFTYMCACIYTLFMIYIYINTRRLQICFITRHHVMIIDSQFYVNGINLWMEYMVCRRRHCKRHHSIHTYIHMYSNVYIHICTSCIIQIYINTYSHPLNFQRTSRHCQRNRISRTHIYI